jgi:hypothetical protein
VGFDWYHSHFQHWTGDGDDFMPQTALQFVKQVIDERIAIVSWWEGGEWRGSSRLEAGGVPGPPSWQAHYDRIRVRSWRGSLDADIGIESLHPPGHDQETAAE